jgi:hypothetical protein
MCQSTARNVFVVATKVRQPGRVAASLTAARRDARSAAGSVTRWRLFRAAGSGAIGFEAVEATEAGKADDDEADRI